MSSKDSRSFWIRTSSGAWGPFAWTILREWLALKWLPPGTEVAEQRDGPWQPAQSVDKLWKGTLAISKRIEEFEIVDLESEKIPLSSALKARLHELGWPGNVELLRNYYWGNKLRETLELLFPDSHRSLFDDPDWPKCWSWSCPAASQRQDQMQRSEPLTSSQREILTVFLGENHAITTKGDASEKIEDLLDDPDNEARWEDHKSRIPATERQRERLRWWAEKLGQTLPSPLMKAETSRIIDRWLEEHGELESQWYAEKDRRENLEIESQLQWSDIDEWREFYACQKISEAKVRNVVETIGSRRPGEPINHFMDRFFVELRQRDPALFKDRKSPPVPSPVSKPRSGCLVLCVGLFLAVITLVTRLV